jgi:flagellar biosynthesis protein FlhA
MKKRTGAIGVPAAVISVVVMLVVPMPSAVLDVLISANISGAVVILLMTMHVKRPLDFSAFPPVLLVATLFRLALNVSATRLVLLHGYAGSVISAFGSFVVGGQLVVGMVVFLILIVIQFVVVTSGAGRVAEVAARFTLDAMPGKQMSIDADLNSGLIDQAEAKRRRQEIADEADFYGAMDGASKFVRGDAIAAIVITSINLIGGLAIGVLQHHLSVSAATHRYSLLSIGDGLVSQIPALLMSISTGLVVTRAATEEDDFGADVVSQITRQHRALTLAGGVMTLMAIVPGLPHLAFFVVGITLIVIGRRVSASVAVADEPAPGTELALPGVDPDSPQALATEMKVEPLELELGANVIDLVDASRGGDLLDRVKGLRRKLAVEKGLIIPSVRTRDNVALDPDAYVIRINGVETASGTAPPGRFLAIGSNLEAIPGENTVEPVFGLPAKWVPAESRQQALIAGATVIDRSSVITTHLGEISARYAGRLLSAQQVRTLLDRLKATDPAILDEMAAAQVTLTDVHRVLCGLLDESVAIRDLVRIVEAITERGRQSREPEVLLEAARNAIGPAITADYARDGTVAAITLDAAFERQLLEAVRTADGGTVLAVDPGLAEGLIREVQSMVNTAEQAGREPVIVCASRLRPALHRLLATGAPRLGILSINELGPNVKIERIGVVNVTAETV